MRSAKEFFFAWRKRRNVMRSAGQKNWPISASQFRQFPTRSGGVYNGGWTVRSEPRSRFAEWKRLKKNMKLHFAISETAFSPAKPKSTRRRLHAKKPRSKKIPKKRSRKCRFSINSRDSARKKRNAWPNDWAKILISSCKRWRRANLGSPSTVFRRRGNLPLRRQFPLPSARSFRLSLFSSCAE